MRIGPSQFLAGSVNGEEPFDLGAFDVAAMLPPCDLGDEGVLVGYASVEALPHHHADFDLNHIEPARVLRREVKLDAVENPPCLRWSECLIERPRRMCRQIVEHNPDLFCRRVVNIDELSHTFGEIQAGTLVGDLGASPGTVYVDEHEDVGGAVSDVLVVDPPGLAGFRKDRYALFADQLPRRLIEAEDRKSVV